jgi:hypothetical protein
LDEQGNGNGDGKGKGDNGKGSRGKKTKKTKGSGGKGSGGKGSISSDCGMNGGFPMFQSDNPCVDPTPVILRPGMTVDTVLNPLPDPNDLTPDEETLLAMFESMFGESLVSNSNRTRTILSYRLL